MYTGVKDTELAHEPVPFDTCESKFPIWAFGSFPTENNEIDIEACVVNETSTCARKYQIKVRNCGNNYIFYLKPTAEDEAYCFKNNEDDDTECEKKENYGKNFHRCQRTSRYVVLLIVGVVISSISLAIVVIFVWRRRRAAAAKRRQEVYKENPHECTGPVVVVTDGSLPPKKY